jgi:hypothetical protein
MLARVVEANGEQPQPLASVPTRAAELGILGIDAPTNSCPSTSQYPGEYPASSCKSVSQIPACRTCTSTSPAPTIGSVVLDQARPTVRRDIGHRAPALHAAERSLWDLEWPVGVVRLAKQLSAFPQACMRADRLSSYQQWSLSVDEALTNEFRGGRQVLASPEFLAGVARFFATKTRQ